MCFNSVLIFSGNVGFMEKICSIACYAIGVVFLIVALAGAWRHLFTVGACIAVGILASEEKDA